MKHTLKTILMSALGVAATSMARAEIDVNLTAAVREAQAASECGAPTITGTGHASYPCTNAFDGVTHDSASKYRWLGPAGAVSSAWAQYVAPTDFESDQLFALSGYRLTRLYNTSGNVDSNRAPNSWEIYGVLPSGTLELILTGSHTWGSGDEDDVRIQTFSAGSAAKYRGFKFLPLTSSGAAYNEKFGLLEVEFFVSWIGGDMLTTLCDPSSDTEGFAPAVNSIIATNATCTAPAEIRVDGFPYLRVGYTLETLVDDEWTGGDVTNAAASYTYDHSQSGTYRLTWRYAPGSAYNLTKAALAAGCTVTAGGPDYSGYWVSNVFDGVTHYDNPSSPATADLKRRWLCKREDSPYAQMDVDPSFRANFDLRPVAYRVWRLYDSNDGVKRHPTAWTLKGVCGDGTETNVLSEISGVSWTSGDEDAQRCKGFEIPHQESGDYRTFIFTPSAYSQTDTYTGLLELEIFVEESAHEVNALEIASAADVEFACSPAVGSQLDAATTCTRTSKGFLDHRRYAPAGYKLYRFENSSWVQIACDSTANTYEWDGTGGVLKLEWQWGAVDGCELSVSTYGGETFTLSPAPDADGYYDVGTVVTVTPNGQSDPVSAFASWAGTGVPQGSEQTNPLELTIGSDPVSIRGDFTRRWKHVPDEGESVAGVITDGNWSLRVVSDTATPVGDYTADLLLSPGAYLAGQGELDFRLLAGDTGHAISRVASNAMTNRTGMTGLRLASGLGQLEAMSFAFSPDVRFVEMPDSVVRLVDGSRLDGDGGAFGHCDSLERVTLSANLAYLGHQSFGSCTNLTTVTPFLPASLTRLGSAFQRCSALTNTPDLAHVRELVNGCFYGCSSISGHLVATNVESCSTSYYGAFEGTGVTSARICNLTTRMFYGCPSLTNVSCTAGFTGIWGGAFQNCPSLASVSADDGFAALQTIGGHAFDSCVSLKSGLPSNFPSVTTVGEKAFYLVNQMESGSFSFPSAATLEKDAFNAAGLKSVDLRKASFTELLWGSFSKEETGSTYVRTVVLPSTVTNLASHSLAHCTGSRKLYFTGLPPVVVDADAFNSVPAYGLQFVYVPTEAAKLAAWQADSSFVALDDIEDKESKENWEAVKDNPSLIGTWRGFWCFARNPPAGGVVILYR